MLKFEAAGRLTTSASTDVLSGTDRAALEKSRVLFAQANLAAAYAEDVTEEEQAHYLQVAQRVAIESAVFTSAGKRYQFTAIRAVRP